MQQKLQWLVALGLVFSLSACSTPSPARAFFNHLANVNGKLTQCRLVANVVIQPAGDG